MVTKRSFHHNINPASNQNTYFTKVIQFGSLIKEMSYVQSCSHLVTNNSFHHSLNPVSNKNTSFTKVIQYNLLIKEMS